MKRLSKYLVIAISLMLSVSCKKQTTITDETEFSIEIDRNEFQDTLYSIDGLNVISTNDTVLNDGVIILKDDNNHVIFNDKWHNLQNFTFGLPDRRNYELTATLMLNDSLESVSIDIDNNEYPDFVKVNSIQIDASILSNDGTYYVSNSHTTLMTIYHALTSYLYEPEDYDVELATKFYQKSFAPKKTSFTFSNLQFPTRAINRKWRFYEIVLGYPLVVGPSGSTVVNDREITFYINVEDLAKNGNNAAAVPISVNSSDSSEGGIYFGTIEFEWIYEN